VENTREIKLKSKTRAANRSRWKKLRGKKKLERKGNAGHEMEEDGAPTFFTSPNELAGNQTKSAPPQNKGGTWGKKKEKFLKREKL